MNAMSNENDSYLMDGWQERLHLETTAMPRLSSKPHGGRSALATAKPDHRVGSTSAPSGRTELLLAYLLLALLLMLLLVGRWALVTREVI